MSDREQPTYAEILQILSEVDRRVIEVHEENRKLLGEMEKLRMDLSGMIRRYGIHLNHYHNVAADEARGRTG